MTAIVAIDLNFINMTTFPFQWPLHPSIYVLSEYDQNCRLHWNILSSLMDRLHCELVDGVKINYVNSL